MDIYLVGLIGVIVYALSGNKKEKKENIKSKSETSLNKSETSLRKKKKVIMDEEPPTPQKIVENLESEKEEKTDK